MSEELLWYPWYWQKWAADPRVKSLSFAARGLYRELLDAGWKRNGLPKSPAKMAELVSCPLAEFSTLWPDVRRFWFVAPDGLLRNVTQEEVRTAQRTKRQRLAEAGRKGGATRQANAKPSQANAKHRLAKEKSRVETTLTMHEHVGGGAFVKRSASTGADRVGNVVGRIKPTPCGHPDSRWSETGGSYTCPTCDAKRPATASGF